MPEQPTIKATVELDTGTITGMPYYHLTINVDGTPLILKLSSSQYLRLTGTGLDYEEEVGMETSKVKALLTTIAETINNEPNLRKGYCSYQAMEQCNQQ